MSAARFPATLAALTAGMMGYALAEAITAGATSEAFIVAPSPARVAGYGLALAILAALALALELGTPAIAARGGRATRGFRAVIRRRFRHGRTRAEITKVERGLTISFCLVLAAAALALASAKSILVLLAVAGIAATIMALWSLCRLVGFHLKWSALIGFLYGFAVGYLLT